MKFLLLFSLLGTLSYAQTPEKDFLEITPEQEKKIQEKEKKKADLLRKKEADEKRKKEDIRIAAEKEALRKKEIAEETKRLEAEKKKKEEIEAYTKWLISERDRKMQEKKNAEEMERKTAEAEREAARQMRISESERRDAEDRMRKEEIEANYKSRLTLPPRKVKDYARNENPYPPPRSIPNTRAEGGGNLARANKNCSYQKLPEIHPHLKVVALATYEGSIPGRRRRFREHIMTEVTINLNQPGVVALVLLTYEPIKWKIKKNATDLRAVFVMGYHKQVVEVDGETIIVSTFKESELCGYSDRENPQESPEDRSRRKLEQLSQGMFGKQLDSFRYQYSLPAEYDL